MSETLEVRQQEAEFLEDIDNIMESFMDKRKMLRLPDRTFKFAQDLLDIHHILVNPNIPRSKEMTMVCKLLNVSQTKARKLRKAHTLIWGDAKGDNDAFLRKLVAEKILKFAQEEEKEGNREKAAEYYEKYYKMRGFDKDVQQKTPRPLPAVITFSTDPRLLEIELTEAEILEDE